MSSNKENTEDSLKLTDEQLAENKKKIDEYYRYFKVFLFALGMTFAVIVGIVVFLVIQNSWE